nr:reverse transcriptase domain-containing protein [Tanacetum cinerariifolium]
MGSQSASTIHGACSSSAPTGVQILPNNRNPLIGKEFNIYLMSDNTKKAQCIHCFHFFSKDSNSTLKNHISHPHCEALKRVSKSGQWSMSRDGSIFVYNPDVLREQFAGLVIQRGKGINVSVLSRMAMDIISVQATSVASESAFSTCGRVLLIRRTRHTPESLEMCICLKDHLDAQERKQHKSSIENAIDFEEEILDAEVQQNESISLFKEEIAIDVASSEGTMPSSGSGEEEEKERNAKLKEVKARLNFNERSGTSRYSYSKTMSTKEHEMMHRSRRSRSTRPSVFLRIRCDRSRSPRQNLREKQGGVFKRLENRGRSVSARSDGHNQRSYSSYTEAFSESEDSGGGHWKSISKKKKSSREEDDLSQPWVCEEIDPFTHRIRYFNFPKTRMPSHIKTYDGSQDPEDHLKIFQATAKIERWAMPTWCHVFNSTLIGNVRVWFDDLSTESIDSYDDLKKVFLENYLQQKKCIKDPIELYNIKQRDEESTKDFVRRYKLEIMDVKGALECMRIFGFVYGITNPELIKRLHDKILKTVDEMIKVTTSFLMGEAAASNHERKKSFPTWKQQEGNQKQNFKKGGFWNHQKPERKQDRFTLLTKTPKEIFALEKAKFKAPPPMTTPVEKRNHTKFFEFHGEVRHNTDESTTHLIGFSGEVIWLIGQIQLMETIGDEEHSASAWMNFVVGIKRTRIKLYINGKISVGLGGSSCTDGFGAGLILTNPEGIEFTYSLRFRFGATNNEAEYRALIARLSIAKQMGVKNIQANVDSRLVANQERTIEVDLVQNNEALEINIDLLEERREQAAIQDTWKLGSKWEGPYDVTEALGKGAYKLRDRDEKQLSWT